MTHPMTKKKVKQQPKPQTDKYLVLQDFRREGKWYHREGKLIKSGAIPGENIDDLIKQGILQAYDNKNTED
jgi:hypothetical protein